MTDHLSTAIHDLITTYNELNPSTIDELYEEPTALEFMRYVARNQPFVVRGGATDWDAVRKWDADYLLETVGDSLVNVAVTPFGYVFFFLFFSLLTLTLTLLFFFLFFSLLTLTLTLLFFFLFFPLDSYSYSALFLPFPP
jgi:hypothetical protein